MDFFVPVVELLSRVRLFCNPMDCSLPGSPVHGISQARILEWVAMSFSRGSSQPRDQTHVSWIFCIGWRILCHWATWEALGLFGWHQISSSYKRSLPKSAPVSADTASQASFGRWRPSITLGPQVVCRGYKQILCDRSHGVQQGALWSRHAAMVDFFLDTMTTITHVINTWAEEAIKSFLYVHRDQRVKSIKTCSLYPDFDVLLFSFEGPWTSANEESGV